MRGFAVILVTALLPICRIAVAGFGINNPSSINSPAAPPSIQLQQHTRRRDILTKIASLFYFAAPFTTQPSASANAVAAPTSFKTVELLWDIKEIGSFPIAVNGVSNYVGSAVRISYQQPSSSLLGKITVYQKTGNASTERLEKASRGTYTVSRALDIGDRIGDGLKQRLALAKLERVNKSIVAETGGGRSYYEYDMVSPPERYDGGEYASSRYLFAATVLNTRLYVFLLECDEREWEEHKEEFFMMRSSFRVESVA